MTPSENSDSGDKPEDTARPSSKGDDSKPDDAGQDGKRIGDGGADGAKKDGAKDGDENKDGEKKDDGDPPPKPLKERPLLLLGIAVVLIAAIIGGVLYWLDARQYESTDDAYIDGHIVRVAPQVSGIVRQVLVDDNQIVGPRELLAVIDTAQPQAKYEGLVAQAKQARATVVEAQAQVGVSLAQVAAARANVIQPQADLDKALADLARYRTAQAIDPAAVAAQQVDAAVQAVNSARGRRDAAIRQVTQAQAQVKASRAQVVGDRTAIGAADAQVAATGVDLANSRIIAPIVGRVTNRNVSPGSYVQPGQEMLAIVPLKLWITANFKETQLKLMRVGQPVDITIDTVPDVAFHGHVESFQRGAGQAFQLLPAENATGNFVKVVQRVPVRISIDSPGIQSYPVGPGMSVVPRVKVR
ncbi:efflux RND transporter periplasmic adaptor subunit [Polymorphobacter sp. PAMC 29334]|uniref:HlyD family secretion protein n=1 Tax=Polymorphobacter sp. PAMC 29334 TaxID=2862331 RepID=UPI001C77A1A6|nr:HlyD family secretion protein [Polymorphobacter sp. PAMC 29334]QYE35552.1 efflux RND transporter periplasmic adaptor subunit [Polymorphobacter sp. PAMC 29334]